MGEDTNATTETNAPVARRVEYSPMAPVGRVANLKALFDAQRDSIANVMPKHVTADRLFKTLMVAVNRNPDLLQCTQSSVIDCVSRAGELGLDLSGTTGEAYPVPFNNRVKDEWVKQCQLIIGYRGLAKLARQSGEIKRIDSDIVCENDDFTFSKGSGGACRFVPNLRGDRGNIIGAYAYVEFKDGGEQYDFMAYTDIEKVRARSKSGSDKNGNAIGAWKTDWSEMAKKTVFRRLSKWLPLSSEKFQRAVELDNDDYINPDVLDVRRVGAGNDGTSAVTALKDKIAGSLPESSDEHEQPKEYDLTKLSPEVMAVINAYAEREKCDPNVAVQAIIEAAAKPLVGCDDLRKATADHVKKLREMIGRGDL